MLTKRDMIDIGIGIGIEAIFHPADRIIQAVKNSEPVQELVKFWIWQETQPEDYKKWEEEFYKRQGG